MDKQLVVIKDVLERLYGKYNHHEFIKPDPLQFVYLYSSREDREIVAFLAAALAYGRVQQIEKSLNDLFGCMGTSPYAFVMNFSKVQRQKLRNFKHRFTSGDSLSDLLELLKKVLSQYSSIQEFFGQDYKPNDKNIISALSKFCDSLLDMYAQSHNGHIPKGLSYLLPGPAVGSACKRLNLFLRWMVRNDEVDLGLWESIDKAKLIVPVDVHMSRLCRILGLYNRKTVSLATAVEITKSFTEIEPNDPVKYDFALSRIGILDGCTAQLRSGCELCELFRFCSCR